MFHISTRLRVKRAHAKSQIPRRSHAQWCIDVFVNPVITAVIYIRFYPITKTSRYNDNQQPISYCQHGYYSHTCTTSVHTSAFIVSLSKWSLTFKIIPGVSPRIDLILLVLICRVTPNNYKVVGTNTYSISQQPYICIPRIMKTNTRLYSVLNCTVHVSVCRRFVCQRFWSVDVLICRRFGLVWFVDVLVCRRFGLSTFRSVDALVCWCVLVCRRFGLSTL